MNDYESPTEDELRISILDVGSTSRTLELARRAETLGYHRY